MKKQKKDYPPKECETCGEWFKPKSNTQRFCCPKCREKSEDKIEERKCYVCGGAYEVRRGSNAQRCPKCRKIKYISTVNVGTEKTRKCKFTANVDNTPDGAKKEDMWLGDLPQPQEPKPVKAKIKKRDLPKAPYPPAHVRKVPLHIPNIRAYNLPNKPSRFAYSPEQDAVIRDMFDDGATWDEIGDELGRSGDAVRRHAQIIFGGTLMRDKQYESM